MTTLALPAVVLAANAIATPPALGQAPERLAVRAQVRPSTCFVGQVVDLAVGVVGDRERPKVTPPLVDGADVALVRTELIPLSVSAIGDTVSEKNLYQFRFRLVPRRTGSLTVPPVSVKVGDRSGSSGPVRLTVRPVPLEGRPGAFLGGVGEFEVEATAEPTSTRSGEPFEYRVTVRGPAAWGTKSSPSLDRLSRLPLGFLVERVPDVVTPDPPSRALVFRVRPTRPGTASLPPVSVAAFDPATGRYVTKVTESVPVRVVDVPRFDPSSVDYAPPSGAGQPGWWSAHSSGFAAGLGALALAGSGLAVWLVRRRRDTGRAVRRLTRRVAEQLGQAGDDPERGRVITEGLAEYLRLTTGRPPGALTPDEAETGVARATGDLDLARRAGRLIAVCDRVRYGLDNDHPADPLTRTGRLYFRGLSERETIITHEDL
jgi:hypothetical protein